MEYVERTCTRSPEFQAAFEAAAEAKDAAKAAQGTADAATTMVAYRAAAAKLAPFIAAVHEANLAMAQIATRR